MRVVFVHGACVRDGAWWCADSVEHITEIVANSPPS